MNHLLIVRYGSSRLMFELDEELFLIRKIKQTY